MSVRWPVEYQVRNLKMENIIQKIREIYPVSDEALQALQANMELRYYPKDTYIVQSGVTDRLVYFIEEGIARSVFHHNGHYYVVHAGRRHYVRHGFALLSATVGGEH